MGQAIFLNFKTYEKGTGKNALETAKIAEKVAKETGTEIVLIVQPVDLRMISKRVSLKVFAEAVDAEGYGSHTGCTTMEALIEAGAKGAMINHSESRVPMEEIKSVVEKAKKLNFLILACVENLEEAKEAAELGPDYIAFEEKELIGSGKPITEAEPDAIRRFVETVGDKSIPLCGAGISSKEDVKASAGLGAKGVLLASAVIKAEDPEKMLRELAE